MANYQCPKCDRYGMDWDGRAKVLMCYYTTCSYVIRMQGYNGIPAPEDIDEAIGEERSRIENAVTPDLMSTC